MEPIFDYIDRNRNVFIERLIDYLRQPSISAHGEGMDKVADYLVGWLDRLGFEASLMPTPGWPLVLGYKLDQPGASTVLLYGHYDVQPPDPLEEWVTPPFEPSIRDGRIYARGVGDNKGQHFAQILAVESTLAVAGRLPCNVIFLLEGEEETGSPHIADFIRQHRHRLKADLVITSDGPLPPNRQPKIECGVRGVIGFELRARGANRDLHSGNFGGVAPNPLWTLVHLLGTMKNERGEITIEGFYDNVDTPTVLERQVLARLPLDEQESMRDLGITHFDAPSGRSYYERLAFWPTLTINGLHGGYSGPESKTVLPHEAFAKCDIRLVESQAAEEIFTKVEAHVKRHAPGVEFIRQGGMDPSKTPLDSPYIEPLKQALMAATGQEPLLFPAMGGSLPDYVFTKTLGIPDFTIPYANADENNHAPNENIELDLFIRGIKCGAAMLSCLGEMRPK